MVLRCSTGNVFNGILSTGIITFDTLTWQVNIPPLTIRLCTERRKPAVNNKLSVFMCRCLDGTAAVYLAAHSAPVSATDSTHHLRSAASRQFVVPSDRTSSDRRRAFSVAVGPMTWNSLPRHLRDPVHTISVFGRLLKTFFLSEY